MSITTKLHLRHDRLALVPTLRALDDVDISVITQGLTDPGRTAFPFFIRYGDREALDQAFEEDVTVADYQLVDWTGETGIYYLKYTPETVLISTVVAKVNGVLVSTQTRGDGWAARLVLPVWERHLPAPRFRRHRLRPVCRRVRLRGVSQARARGTDLSGLPERDEPRAAPS